ncbi:sulfatase [Halorarum halophilum]|uniref:Sulfatase n=1 Tax=Halorarum halophilum TaxID=2743090 RepID=A0A7D5KVB8_9EURY|nr:sulfatase [Halobaculum halophilum]QLG28680.1 sulfatase [Halobaculum halophilum]
MATNVVLIVVDALRYDRVGVSSVRTPTLDHFARKNTTFTDAIANSNTTDICVTTIQTGQYPIEHGVLHHGTDVTERERQFGHGAPSLAERLKSEGYQTIAVEPVLKRWHRDGFDRFVDGVDNDDVKKTGMSGLIPDWAISMGGSILDYFPTYVQNNIREAVLNVVTDTTDGKGVTKSALELLDDVDEDPFFCFLHYWDVHTPYNPPENYVEAVKERNDYDETPLQDVFEEYGLEGTITGEGLRKRKLHGRRPETIGEIQAHYDAAVEYVDDCIGDLFEGLEQRGLDDDTLLVVTADHGESMTEKGVFFDHHGLHDPVVHVPLLFGGTDIPNSTVSATVQHVDVAPTICELIGIQELPGVGESLVPLMRGNTTEPPRNGVAFAEERHTRSARMIRQNSLKLINTLEGDGSCRYCQRKHEPSKALYDLDSDPSEKANLLNGDEYCSQVRALLEQFEEFEMGLIEPTPDDSISEYDEAELENRLEHLGYR